MFTPAPNAMVDGRFELLREIGRGAMGSVWAARDNQLDAPCALKFIAARFAGEAQLRARFMREARVASNVRSPHAITVFGVGEWAGTPYIAMELLDGETLGDRLERVGVLPFAAVSQLVQQVAEVLDRAHALGVVHRDLKPDNLWLCSGKEIFVKVLDFGVARQLDSMGTVQTATGMLVGTPQYMSPEQAAGSKEVDHRSDLWSLAVIVAECLTGKVVFDASGIGELFVKILTAPVPPLRSLGPHLPQGLESWWSRAMARDPRQRFGSASEFSVALRASGAVFSSGPTLDVRPVSGGNATMPLSPPSRLDRTSQLGHVSSDTGASGAQTPPRSGSPLQLSTPSPEPGGTAPLAAFVGGAQRPSTVEPVSSPPRASTTSSAGVALRSFALVLAAIAVVAVLVVVGVRLSSESEPDVAVSSELPPEAPQLLPEASDVSAPRALPDVGASPSLEISAPSAKPESSVAAASTSTLDTSPPPAATVVKDAVVPSPRVNRAPPTAPAPSPRPTPAERSPRQSLERQLGF